MRSRLRASAKRGSAGMSVTSSFFHLPPLSRSFAIEGGERCPRFARSRVTFRSRDESERAS